MKQTFCSKGWTKEEKDTCTAKKLHHYVQKIHTKVTNIGGMKKNPYETNLLFKRLDQVEKDTHTKKLHHYVQKIHSNIRGMKQKCSVQVFFLQLSELTNT